jgi:hypothetical protein
MRHVWSALQSTGRRLRRLAWLVRDDDHDDWYDHHQGGQKPHKPPRIHGAS